MAIDPSVSLVGFLPNPQSYSYVTWYSQQRSERPRTYKVFGYDRLNVKERVDDGSHWRVELASKLLGLIGAYGSVSMAL